VGLFFDDPLFEEFTSWMALGTAPYGGGVLGEVRATCALIEDGNDESWFRAWRDLADRREEAADASAARGHRVSAYDAYLRASVYNSVSYHTLFGAPVDPRLVEGFDAQRRAFDKAAALLEPSGEAIEIPFEEARMPAYLFRVGASEPRPLLIALSGYDSALYESFIAVAVPALRRGYHCLVFDAPGQGAVLFEQGLPIRADWETVICPVVDAALGLDGVDPDRIALTGWSLAGLLALRAASGESRLAACIADPALHSIGAGMIGRLRAAGVQESVIERYPDIDEATLEPLAEAIHNDRAQRWAIEQRGFWVHGVETLGEYIRATLPFTMEGRLESIRCPTMVTRAENDPLGRSAEQVYEALACPKTLLHFTAAEGAGDHCEMGNRPLYDQRIFDWLDETLAA
jgi:pimeloyl-ACP methyl ester carboxylesterase